MDLFDKTKKLSHEHLRDLAGMCAGVAILLFVAVFMSGGFGKTDGLFSSLVSPTSQTAGFFGGIDLNCTLFGAQCDTVAPPVYGIYADKSTVTAGSPVTLTWAAYYITNGVSGQVLNANCQQNVPDTGFGGPSGNLCTISNYGPVGSQYSLTVPTEYCDYLGCSDTLEDVPATPTGTAVVYPTQTTTYTFVSRGTVYLPGVNGPYTNLGTRSVTITVTPATTTQPTLTIDAGAGNGATRTVVVGTVVTINTTVTPGSGDTVTKSSIVDNNSNALPGINTSVPPTNKSATFTPSAPGTFIFYPSVQTVAFPGWSNYNESVTIVVNPAPPTSCANGLGSSYKPSCTCPAGQMQSGATCIAIPPVGLCANGLANSYAPSCTCPAGQHQSGALCVPNIVVSCANGLANSYAPSCTCPVGQVQSGSSCVLKGVINSLIVSPSRVLKGNTAIVTWSTTGMKACALSGLTASGTTALSSVLSSSMHTEAITGKTIFTLNCSDATGASYSSSVTLNLIPQTIEQ